MLHQEMTMLNLINTLMLVFLSGTALAKVEYLNLELKRLPYQRDYLVPEQTVWDHEVSLNMKLELKRLWLESDLTGQTAQGRFRNMWWDYTMGLSIVPELDLVWDHRSQHLLDWEQDKFPVRDSYGIRINFKK